MALLASDIAGLSRLLDEAMDLPLAQREAWFNSLPETERRYEPMLRPMLAERDSDATPDFLAAMPSLPDEAREEDSAAAGDLIGPYRLIREVGRGGMGAVWLAERCDGNLKREVALKLPRLAWGTGLAERMARERDIGALLAHPHIARLYDAGVDQRGRPYLALEYIEGQALDVWCSSRALPLRERLRLFLQVVRAVAYAHGRLVVHRDLKPSNVLVSADGQAHLLDFGIAKMLTDADAAEAGLTQQQGQALTPHYAAPEQLRGEAITVASDIYSLGVLLYRLLTDQQPHEPRRSSLAALEEAILEGAPAPASSRVTDKALAKALRGDLDAILAKALRQDPNQRYATADALADDLERHLRGDAVLAQPDSLGYRLRKTLARHRWSLAAGAAILVATLTGAGVSVVQAQRANAESQRARMVKDFVVNVFKVNDRGNAANQEMRQLPAELLLDRGARLIAVNFAGQDDLQAELYGVVARILLNMKSYPLAQDYAKKQVSALHAAGSRGELLSPALLLLGEAFAADMQFTEAQASAAQALAAASNAEHQVSAHLLLADVLDRLDKEQAALVELDSADLLLRQAFTAPHVLKARAQGLRARVLVALERFDQARPLYEQAIEAALAAEGPSSPLASKIRLGLARHLVRNGFTAPAQAIYRETFAAMRAIGGADDPDAALLEADAASTLADSGAILFDEANASITTALTTLERQGPRIPAWVRAEVEGDAACLALRFGRVQLGNQLAERSARVLRATDRYGLSGESCLNFGLMMAGRHDEADAALNEELSNELKGSSCCVAHTYVVMAMNRMMNGQPTQAREALAAAPAFAPMVGATSERADWRARAVLAASARIEVEQGRYDEALRILKDLPDAKYMMNDAGFIRGEALCRLGQAAQALPLMYRGMERSEDYRDGYALNPKLANLRSRIGICELSAGHRPEATKLAELARQAFQGQPEVSPYYKAALKELDKRLAMR